MKFRKAIVGFLAAGMVACVGLCPDCAELFTVTASADGAIDIGEGDREIIESTVLNSDLNVLRDLVLKAPLDLNGYTLTVGGDLVQLSGKLSVNKGKVDIGGAYCCGNREQETPASPYVYSKGTGYLYMVNDEDIVNVGGDFISYSVGNNQTLTKGTLTVNGDLLSYDNDFYGCDGKDFRFVFGGKRIANYYNKDIPYPFDGNDLFLRDRDREALQFSHLEVKSPEITVKGYVNFGTLESDVTVIPDDLLIKGVKVNGHAFTVKGNAMLYGISGIDLTDGEMRVDGDVDHIACKISVNSGKYYVTGNYYQHEEFPGRNGYYSVPKADINMGDENGELYIGGDLTFNTNWQSWYYGKTTLDGDLIMNKGMLTFGGENNVFVFGGEKIINNSGSRNSIESSFETKDQSWSFDGSLGFKKLGKDITVNAGENSGLAESTIDGHDLTIKGSIPLRGTVYVNSGTLTIDGDFTDEYGTISLRGGNLHIKGSYYGGEKLDDGTYEINSAHIWLRDDNSSCVIDGDCVCTTNFGDSSASYFTYGTTTINGNLYVYGKGLNAYLTDTGKLIFNGNKIVNYSDRDLSIRNIKAKNAVTVSGRFSLYEPDGDITIIPDDMSLGFLYTGTNTVTIDGDLEHTGGTMSINGGTLHVKGDYNLRRVTPATSSSPKGGSISMRDENGQLIVDGDLNVESEGGTNYNYLKMGTMTVCGDITTLDDKAYFTSDSTHITILAGTGPQNINISAKASFGTLHLTMPRENYTFNREPCWSRIIRLEDIFISEENFPDAALREYLTKEYDKDKSGTLCAEEIANISKISLSGKTITTLKGIELFPELKELTCYSDGLTEIDISKNTALINFYCNNNQLTKLDVSKNTALTTLWCYNNQLTELDLSNNSLLTNIRTDSDITIYGVKGTYAETYANSNKITFIDINASTEEPAVSGTITVSGNTEAVAGTSMEIKNSDGTSCGASIEIASDGTFAVTGTLPDGDYTITANKSKCCPRDYMVTVAGGQMSGELDVELQLYGDVDNNGIVTLDDVIDVINYFNKKTSAISSADGDLQDYLVAVSDVDGDGVVKLDDAIEMINYFNKKASAFDNIA